MITRRQYNQEKKKFSKLFQPRLNDLPFQEINSIDPTQILPSRSNVSPELEKSEDGGGEKVRFKQPLM